MEYTENIALKKPEQEDYYNVEDFNYNADLVDEIVTNAYKNVIDFTSDMPILQGTGGSGTSSAASSPNFAGMIGGHIILKGSLEFNVGAETEAEFSSLWATFSDSDSEVKAYFDSAVKADDEFIGIVGHIFQDGVISDIYAVAYDSRITLYCSFNNQSACYYDIDIPTTWERSPV